ncbi:hypothetical protein [Rhodoferax ferrireducens]|uniref:hypothetical protein n=1 Tax=Rhodoferax ferrireducens TaxID=192843 RepID=UPI003BB6189E
MTFRPGQRVIVDTNVIIEAHRTGCWNTIANYFAIETVEKVIEETQTGAQNRSPETLINELVLRASMRHVAMVTDEMRAKFHESFPLAVLDPGERDLIVYAGTLTTADTWLLNSPDMAAVRHAHVRGWLDRVVSLEAMNRQLKGRLSAGLRENYSEQWLSIRRTRLILG